MCLSISWKRNCKKNFDSIITLKFGEIKAVQEEIYGGKMPIRIIRINVDNTIILKLAETKNNLSIWLDI